MKDLTAKCEMKAKEWDQRSKMRADELTAVSQALAVMQDRVKVKSDQANKRALLQNDDNKSMAPDKEDVDDDDVGDVGFLQMAKSPRHKIGSLLKRAQERHAEQAKVEEEQETTAATKKVVKA